MVIIFTHFLLNFYTFITLENNTKSPIEKLSLAFLKATIYNCAAVYFITELLSVCNAIEFGAMAAFWIILIISNIAYIYFSKKNRSLNLNNLSLKHINKPYKFILLIILGILVFLFWQCLAFPPNNYDSMAYHMPRVMHWLQYKNVNYYPTSITRQLFSNPFAEYAILNFQALSGSDIWANFVQYFAMINSLFVISLIVRQLGANFKIQILAIVVFIANPMTIFQATTTQNDMVVTFFVLVAYYFGLTLNESKTNSIMWFCVSILLGALTKFTSVIIFAPFALYFIWNAKDKLLKISLVGITFSIIFIGPFVYRNMQTFGSPIGPKKGSLMNIEVINDGFSLASTYSNVVRNSLTYLTFPSKAYSSLNLRVAEVFHSIFNLELNNIKNTYINSPFNAQAGYTEDNMGYILGGLILIFCSVYSLFISKSKKKTAYLGILIFLSLVLFSTLLKYQPMHPRLLLSLSALAAIYISLIISNIKPSYQIAIILSLLLSTLPLLFFNKSKPVVVLENIYRKVYGIPRNQLSQSDFNSIKSKSKQEVIKKYYDENLNLKPTLNKDELSYLSHYLIDSLKLKERKSAINSSRIENYFNNKPSLKDDFEAVAKIIKDKKIRNVGISIGFDGMEYPAWVLLAKSNYKFNIYNLNWNPILVKTPNYKPYTIDCLIVETSGIDRKIPKEVIQEKYINDEISLLILKNPYTIQ